MFNFLLDIEQNGLTIDEYEHLLKDCSDKVQKISDDSWDDIVNRYNLGIHGDSLRKSQQMITGGAFVAEYMKNKYATKDASTDYEQELAEKRRELERLKIQFRDERNAWNKQNYTDARVCQKLDYLEEALNSFKKVEFTSPFVEYSDNDMLIILSDLHIGQTFESAFGQYSIDIAKDRLGQLLGEVVKLQELHQCQNCYISVQGDLISGNIHKNIQVTNRENVIDQIKMASELIASFTQEVCKHFDNVYMTNVAGNHSRMDKKDDALHDERLDDLVGWIVSLALKDQDNFHMDGDNLGYYDNGIAIMNIRGNNYINVHGDFDRFNKNGVGSLCMALGFIPYAITFGHLHTCAVDETNGIKMIRGGSLAGSGDDYTLEKRLTGKPSQMVCICNEKGIVSYNPIELA